MAAQEFTYSDIMKDLKARKFYPIYYLMGDEPYYIDQLTNYLLDNVLSEVEKDFNLDVLYGADVDINGIINTARRYPMMSEYRLVVVKEAQVVKGMENLSIYLQKPLNSTILVICHKNGSLDKRKKVASDISKVGVLFDSKRLKESQLPQFINNYVAQKDLKIDSKATELMADFVGSDLSRMAGELDKLIITHPKGQEFITPEQIEKNIGISKDYNNIELRNALIQKDILKANKIIKYFEDNPKSNPIQVTLGFLFSFFSNLMLAYYAPEKTESGVAAFLGFKSSWQAKDYLNAMKKYSGVKTMKIIHEIRYTDAKSKGVGNPSIESGDLLKELIFKILH